MSEAIALQPHEYPDISHLIQEDDTPVDSFINEKQQRLLTEVLYGYEFNNSIPFLVAANVGLFRTLRQPALVPDVFLSLNVTAADDWWDRQVRSYLLWEFGKAPEVVIEIVSPTPGNELGSKLTDYAQTGVIYYVVYDPLELLSDRPLQIFQLQSGRYIPITGTWLPLVGLGLTLWQGVFESRTDTWLRWCDESRNVIPTVEELADQLSQKDAQLSQKDAQLFQKDAQLAESQAQTKQALLLAIELGLKLKFGSSEPIFAEISAINEVRLLAAIANCLLTVNSLDELRQIYQPNSSS